MAKVDKNFKGSINLMKMKGAQVLNVQLPGSNKPTPCVVIPALFNDMVDKDGKVRPYVNLRAWAYDDVRDANFIQACIRNHSSEENYVAPSHRINVNYSEEFDKRARECAENRIRNEHADWTDDAVKQEVNRSVRIHIGELTPLRTETRGYVPSSSVVAVQFSNVEQPAVTQQEAVVDDDLPF